MIATCISFIIDKINCVLQQIPDENTQLKEQIEAMTVSATLLEQKHKEQMSEALENLETVQRAHKREVTEIQANIKQQSGNENIQWNPRF